jgi:hypothetical protein
MRLIRMNIFCIRLLFTFRPMEMALALLGTHTMRAKATRKLTSTSVCLAEGILGFSREIKLFYSANAYFFLQIVPLSLTASHLAGLERQEPGLRVRGHPLRPHLRTHPRRLRLLEY